MDLEIIKRIVDGKKSEVLELEKEEASAIRQFKARRVALESHIEIFEADLKRRILNELERESAELS